jgi:hypothetical protein
MVPSFGGASINAVNRTTAASLGIRARLVASCQGSTLSRASAERTLRPVPFRSAPIGAQRNSSNSGPIRSARLCGLLGFSFRSKSDSRLLLGGGLGCDGSVGFERRGVGADGSADPWSTRPERVDRARQSDVRGRCAVDRAHRLSLARSSAGVWRLEQRVPALQSLKGLWWRIFAAVSDDPDFEYLIIDSTIVRAHQHAAGAKKKV